MQSTLQPRTLDLARLVSSTCVHSCTKKVINSELGFYILHDPDPEQNFGLPTGEYDIPLMIVSKKFNADGSLFDFFTVTGDAFGDVITVNGVPWPFFEVEPRKYRFRLLDASVTRSYLLHLVSHILRFPMACDRSSGNKFGLWISKEDYSHKNIRLMRLIRLLICHSPSSVLMPVF